MNAEIYRDGGNRRGRQKDYMPTMWNEHFEEKEDINLNDEQMFRVYFSKRDRKNKKPLLVLLHGGGYSALTWSHFTVSKYDRSVFIVTLSLIFQFRYQYFRLKLRRL